MPKTCMKCKYSRYYDPLFIECTKYNWKIHVSVAKTQAVCQDNNDKHHVFPEGRKVPIKLFKNGKVML